MVEENQPWSYGTHPQVLEDIPTKAGGKHFGHEPPQSTYITAHRGRFWFYNSFILHTNTKLILMFLNSNMAYSETKEK